ncbi:uncharacterized protein N7496_007829 [Penicillium cataractarum]|uniref:Ketoreductase domain-containing protein n=1 Tax=Penicillium cataractarum TaxID=2100454 RepID=A0A9W9RZ74_9EURO|nr:uncharacterized protein N7496_007829 [Penicillium cataractarum]KAJ5368069.1 hypothetical protein N7496_007829 [Penicillium cataractarum]
MEHSEIEDLARLTNSNALTNFVPTTHHDTYPFITPTGTELASKSILITGASRGLGRDTAIRCTKAGCARIALAARSSLEGVVREIEETAREAGITPPQILPLQVDVTSDESVRAAAGAVEEAFGGRLDILVNNAGYLVEFNKPVHEIDPAEWWKAWEVNVKGTFLCCHYFIPLLLKAYTRIVINMSSLAANCLTYGASAYQASRFANCRLSEFIARDYESQNLICITLHPGTVKTDMADNFPEYLQFLLIDKANLSADTVVWLCSQRREWLNGRFVVGNWDMEELEGKQSEIVERDLFKYRITI